ncbi:MAG: Crp/Fnr family transcriptional regulator [Proteobacteria bacterium]|nr:Crp/Fnr family transcriptional regulator [Pseudomonadota bacterium]
MSDRDRPWLTPAVRAAAADRNLKAGEALFHRGDKVARLFEVLAGHVRLSRVDRSGHEILLYAAGPGDTLAEASLFSPVYHCDAVASSAATVRAYPKAAVLAAFDRDPKAAQAFTATLARQVMSLRTRIEQRNIRSARERLRHWLRVNAGADGRAVVITGTLKDVAAELGLTHEALYRTLAALERQGEIKRGRGKVTLLRPKRP